MDNLLTAVKALFTKQNGSELRKPHAIVVNSKDFDPTFDALIRKFDTGSTRWQNDPDPESTAELTPPSSTASVTGDSTIYEPPPPPKPTAQFRKSVALQQQKDVTLEETM